MALLWRIGGQLVRAPPSFRRCATLLHRSLPHQRSWPLCCATRTCATSSSAEASEAIAPEAVVILESSSMEYRTSHGFAHEDGGYDATTHQHHSNFAEHNREGVAYVFEVITTDARTTESAAHRSSSSNTDQLHEARDGDTTRGTATTTTTTTTTTQCRSFHLFEEVSTLDTYARSRITNLVRGMPGGGANTSLFVVKEEELADGRTVYWASCRLMLPQPHGLHVAEGVAENAKDAELLAAMHAERVCDALGVPLFKLPSRQRKHAETARRQGRYAPMPEDGLQPAGTRVPVPLRMFSTCRAEDDGVRGEAVRGATSAHEEVPLTHNVQSAPLFRVRVAEAEVVSRQRRPKSSAKMDEDGATPHETSSSSARATPAEDEPEWLRRYTEEVVHPWLESRYARRRSTSSPAGVAAGTTNSNSNTKAGSPVFDQTENGMWAMVNVLSARCSPTPEDALVLPYVYEPAARERMKDYFWQRGMELKDRERLTHVAVPGFSTRMYLCELRLAESTVVARGKGQTEEMARNLAAMHAELLVDALGQDLFPRDAARQARHAEAVERYGRWASHPHLPATPPSSTLPLPLKQQAGLDETWMEASGRAARLSDGERIIALHNDLYQRYGDCLEVNPPTELLHEAYTALEEWQRRVAKNTCCGLYVITKMGDFFRATTLTPVPARYGIRGGNAIGRSMEQAVHLCALHAVDMLCLLGIPIFVEPERQANFLARRRALGLSVAAASTTSTDATHHHASLYLPGYIVEGAQQRLPPHASDTMAILKLRTSEDFVVFGSGLQEERLVELGNEAKMCVQHYLRVCGEEHRKQDGNQPKQDVDDGGRLARRPMPDSINPNVYITGYGKKVSVNNIAYLRIPLPPPGMVQNTTNNTLPQPSDEDFRLAVGISLKKKDAERACFLHAVELIHGMGVDVLQHYRSGLPRSVPATPYQVVADNVEERGSQKPFMHAQMMAFLRSGKFMSPPKRRGPPSPYNPFGP